MRKGSSLNLRDDVRPNGHRIPILFLDESWLLGRWNRHVSKLQELRRLAGASRRWESVDNLYAGERTPPSRPFEAARGSLRNEIARKVSRELLFIRRTRLNFEQATARWRRGFLRDSCPQSCPAANARSALLFGVWRVKRGSARGVLASPRIRRRSASKRQFRVRRPHVSASQRRLVGGFGLLLGVGVENGPNGEVVEVRRR